MFGQPKPPINYGDFIDAMGLGGAEDAHEGADDPAEDVEPCDPPPPPVECSITDLHIESRDAEDAVRESVSFSDQDHAQIPGANRFRVIPLRQVKIKWTLTNCDHVDFGTLELFRKGSPNPIWSKQIADIDADEGELDWDTKVTPNQEDFPDDVVNTDRSPYKLKMTISPKEDARCTTCTAWTYFDVDFEHKYKLLNYVPTTNLGRFGLEFNPAEQELKVVIRIFWVLVVHEKEKFQHPLDWYINALDQRCGRMWSRRYRLRHIPGNQDWRISFILQNAGSAQVDKDISALEECPKHIIDQFNQGNAQFCIFLKRGRGQSGLKVREFSRAANVFLYEAAFDEQHSPTLGGALLVGQKDLLKQDIQTAISGLAGHNVVAENIAGAGPTFRVDFDANSDALNANTQTVLQHIAGAIRQRTEGLNFPIWIKGARTAAEAAGAPQPLEQRRAQAIQNELQPHNPIHTSWVSGEPASSVTVQIAYRDNTENGTWIGQPVRYCAAVHEFGHALGLPDEYMDYNASTTTQIAAPSQTEFHTLVTNAALDDCPRPYKSTAELMSTGEIFHKRYYLTLLQAHRKMMGLPDDAEDNNWSLIDPGAPPGAAAPALAPEFDPLKDAVQEADSLVAQGITDINQIKTEMRNKASGDGRRVLYAKVLKRDDLNPPAGAPPWNEDSHLLFVIGVQDGRHLLHCGNYVRPRLVRPVIEVPGHTSRTNDDYLVPFRAQDSLLREKVVLRSTGLFTGNGTFTLPAGAVQFFPQESAGVAIGMPATYTAAQLASGVPLYAEGNLHNAQLQLVLTPTAGRVHTTPFVSRLTYRTPNPWLEVYNVSVDTRETVEPLTEEERRTDGIIIPLNGDNNPGHLRKRVKVKVCIPANWQDRIIFRVRHPNSIKIYKRQADTHSKGSKKWKKFRRGVRWREYTLRPTDQRHGHFPDNRAMVLWLEGLQASATHKDCEIQIVSRAHPNNPPYDSCTATVIECPRMRIEIPPTPPKTHRTINGVSNQPQPQMFDAGQVAGILHCNSPYNSRDFNLNPPLVLIKGSMGAGQHAQVIAEYKPDLPVKWYCQRAADDHASLLQNSTHDDQAPLERLDQQIAAGTTTVKVKLTTDNAGSFHVIMKVGSSTCYVINFVVAEVAALAGPETPHVANLIPQKNQVTAGFVDGKALVAHTGPVPFPNPQPDTQGGTINNLHSQACTVLAGRVQVKGGGPDCKRGVDRVFAGWVQNKTDTHIVGTYTDGTSPLIPKPTYRSTGKFVENQTQGQLLQIAGGADHHFSDARPALTEINVDAGHPLLDTGNANIGGSKTCPGGRGIHSHAFADRVEIVAVAVDSPGTEFLVAHLSQGNALLTRAEYRHTFKSYLCVWTDATRRDTGGENPGPGDLLYGVVAEVEWGFDAAWNVTWQAGIAGMTRDARQAVADWQAQGTIAADPALDFNAQIQTAYQTYPARPAQGLVEVRPPMPIRTFAWDAKSA